MEIKEAAGLPQVHKVNSRHFLQEEQRQEIADKIEEIIHRSKDMFL